MFSLESLGRVTQALADNDSQKMFDVVAELEANGRSLQHFARELARHFRNLVVVRIAGGETRLVSASQAEQRKLAEAAAPFVAHELRAARSGCDARRNGRLAPQCPRPEIRDDRARERGDAV